MYLIKHIFIGLLVSLLAACSSSDPAPTPTPDAEYSIRVTNLTNNQPLSPVAFVLHAQGFSAFVDGVAASVDLEQLAEGGDNASFLASVAADAHFLASTSGAGAVAPQAMDAEHTLTVASSNVSNLHLTVLSMLVNTNDAFTGLNAANISDMNVGEVRTFLAPTWDSGTEGNTESSGTIPGPADTSATKVGFDAARSDSINKVRFHAGVITVDDGLTGSILDQSYRFDNPSSKIVVTRVN